MLIRFSNLLQSYYGEKLQLMLGLPAVQYCADKLACRQIIPAICSRNRRERHLPPIAKNCGMTCATLLPYSTVVLA